VARNLELYSKSTIYDLLNLSASDDPNRVLASTMPTVINDILVLENRSQLIVDELTAFNCTTWCVDIPIEEITRVTGKTMENLKGNPDEITVLEMHSATVKTLEDIYCFNMTVIENSLNISSQFLLESQWALFVTQIVMHSIECKANLLGVTVAELAELLRTNLTTLFAYTLQELSNSFFPNFLSLQDRKNEFETRSSLAELLAQFEEKTGTSGEAEPMLTFAGDPSINFNLRDLEILYGWRKPQLFAIENIPLSSYLSQCFVTKENSLLAASIALFGNETAGPTCDVAYILSRSLNEVGANFNALKTAVEAENSLYIFMTATDIKSWFVMKDILQLSIYDGVWVDIPSVSHVASAANQTTEFIKNCSLPQVIASLKNSNETGALAPFLEINNPSFRNLLLATYGYSYNQLTSLTEVPLAQLTSLSVVELHAIILEALVDRYSISNLHALLRVSDMYVLSTFPSSEWSRTVRAVIQASFAHVADALSVNLTVGTHIAVVNLADGNPSIQINPRAVYFPQRVTTSTLATCLLGRNETDINEMPLPEYHTLFKVNITTIVEGKITFERTSFENLLATDNLVLWQVWNKTIAEVVLQYTGLTVQALECLYGWNESFPDVIQTWDEVSRSRLCSEYEKLTLHRILVQLTFPQEIIGRCCK
jgi:hypothetical protein